jgi:hypothetical protein
MAKADHLFGSFSMFVDLTDHYLEERNILLVEIFDYVIVLEEKTKNL